MASSQIKGLTAATDIAATDVLILQGTTGDAKKITGTNVGGALESGGGVALSLAAAQVAAAGSDSHVQYSNSGVTAGDADLTWNDSTKILTIGASTATAQLKLPISNDAVTPTLAFGDGDTGLYESADDTLTFAIAGAASFAIASTGMTAADANGPALLNETASATNPTLVPDRSDPDTGIGTGTADTLSLIAGGVEIARFIESTQDFACFRVNDDPVADGLVPTSFVALYMDETANELTFKVRYSDGSTVKTGTVTVS
jgi:hypothetical protein